MGYISYTILNHSHWPKKGFLPNWHRSASPDTKACNSRACEKRPIPGLLGRQSSLSIYRDNCPISVAYRHSMSQRWSSLPLAGTCRPLHHGNCTFYFEGWETVTSNQRALSLRRWRRGGHRRERAGALSYLLEPTCLLYRVQPLNSQASDRLKRPELNLKNRGTRWTWGCTPVIPEPERQSQERYELEATLGYTRDAILENRKGETHILKYQ